SGVSTATTKARRSTAVLWIIIISSDQRGDRRTDIGVFAELGVTTIKLTGRDLLPDVLAGIDAALAVGLTPVKLNMVILNKGINDDEVEEFLFYVRGKKNIILQIIELMESWKKRHCIPFNPGHHPPDATRRKYCLDCAAVEVMRPMHNLEFCTNCNRLRFTSATGNSNHVFFVPETKWTSGAFMGMS
ncbi:MAG: hypothetical protein MJ014_05825, partial [Methanocorpusculum sp.]|nr:hypothetical protein [Methanocorpusculum sp.]